MKTIVIAVTMLILTVSLAWAKEEVFTWGNDQVTINGATVTIIGHNQEAIEKANLIAVKTQNRVRNFCQLEAARRHELRLAGFGNTRFFILKSDRSRP